MNPLNVSFLQELLTAVGEQGRSLLSKSLFSSERGDNLEALVDALGSGRGEASGVAIARQLLDCYGAASLEDRAAFFQYLARALRPDQGVVEVAAKAYLDAPGDLNLGALRLSVESPLLEFFRRLNLAPGATAEIVLMRRDLLELMRSDPTLAPVDEELRLLLFSWFNRGFLVLKRIDWHTPAAILEKIIAYEAVHEIHGWRDLRRRLEPSDRRCFAFFHPSMVDEPLIFVEVALMDQIPAAIGPVLGEASNKEPGRVPTTAVFYSISNCQEGLNGISFGHFLIKQVVEELAREVVSLKTFVTLSPVPGFARWLADEMDQKLETILSAGDREILKEIADPAWHRRKDEKIKGLLLSLAAHYFLNARTPSGKVVDPVARFHLGNGARLERINWLGDLSQKGLGEGHGLMVNYCYDPRDIETNHEAFANEGVVVVSRAVRSMMRGGPRTTGSKIRLLPSFQESLAEVADAGESSEK